jgi:hypothetical protein
MNTTTHKACRQFGCCDYFLVATGREGDALYEWRNRRMGGRDYKIVNPDGSVRSGTTERGGRIAPKPPTAGRWAWIKEG